MKLTIKTKRILAGVAGGLLVLAVLLFYSAINGDPVSRAWANARAVAYAQKLYPQYTFTVVRSDGGQWFDYLTTVQARESVDTQFQVYTRYWLNTSDENIFDEGVSGHGHRVENGWNTAVRMEKEAAETARQLLTERVPAMTDTANVLFTLCYREPEGDEGVNCRPDLYLDVLERDAPFTPDLLDSVPARMELSIPWNGVPTMEDAQNILREAKALMDKEGWRVSHYAATLYDTNVDYHEGLETMVSTGAIPAADIK